MPAPGYLDGLREADSVPPLTGGATQAPGGGPGSPGDTVAARTIPMTPKIKPSAKNPPTLRFLYLAITAAMTPHTSGGTTNTSTIR
jgi:hypothetical protein